MQKGYTKCTALRLFLSPSMLEIFPCQQQLILIFSAGTGNCPYTYSVFSQTSVDEPLSFFQFLLW